MAYSFDELMEQIQADRKIFEKLSDAVQKQYMIQFKRLNEKKSNK